MSFMERLDSPLSMLVALLWLAAFCTIFAKLEIYHFLMMMVMTITTMTVMMMIMMVMTTVPSTPHYKVETSSGGHRKTS